MATKATSATALANSVNSRKNGIRSRICDRASDAARGRRSARRALTACAAAVAISLLSVSPRVTAATNGEPDCPTASEQGQKLRDQGKIIRAREMFLVCARATCPSVVRKDCAKWLPEVEETLPTVVFEAHDGQGADVAAVKVSVDGDQVAASLDGKPVPVDPGQHVFKYETQGATPVTQTIVVRSGEKNRLLKVDFPPPPGQALTPKTPKITPDTASPRPAKSGPPVLAFVLGGVGVLAIGSFAFFGITGKSDLSDLKSSCAPYCDPGKLDDAKTKLLVADLSLGVGILALGGATIVFLTSGSDKKTGTTVRVTPLATGGGGFGGSLGGTF
jgi:hypothetical protein